MADLSKTGQDLYALADWYQASFVPSSDNETDSNEIEGRANLQATAEGLTKSMGAVAYQIGVLAHSLNDKLEQLQCSIHFLADDLNLVERRVQHHFDNKDETLPFFRASQPQKLEKISVNPQRAQYYREYCSVKRDLSKPVDFSILDNCTTLPPSSRRIKEDQTVDVEPIKAVRSMSIRSSISRVDESKISKWKRIDIPGIPSLTDSVDYEELPPSPIEDGFESLNKLIDEMQTNINEL